MVNILCEVLRREHKDQASACLLKMFLFHEPMTRVIGLSEGEFRYFLEIQVGKAIKDELSVVAIDQENGQLVGCFISEDFVTTPPQGFEKVTPKLLPIFDLLETLDNQYKDKNPVEPGKLLRMFMAGVYKEYAGTNITVKATRLMEETAKSRHYRACIAEATNPISQHILEKLGYTELHSLLYKDYTYKGEHVFKDVTFGDSCKLFYKELY